MSGSWLPLLVLTSPHGVKGALHAKPFVDLSNFAEYGTLTDESGATVDMRIIGGTQEAPIIAIHGVTDRNQAELLRGKKIGVLRSQLKDVTDADTYYIADLIGMAVVDEAATHLGEVIHVANFGAGDILEIRFADGHDEMFAFTKATFPKVDTTLRHITFIAPHVLAAEKPAPKAASKKSSKPAQ